jgi:hypothetical protein
MRAHTAAAALSGLLVASCGAGPLATEGGPDAAKLVVGFDGEPTGPSLDGMRLRPEVCKGEDLKPPYETLDERDLVRFLQRQNLDVRTTGARSDLVYLTVTGHPLRRPVRLRVAMLPTAEEAGAELHRALLQHGSGYWGVRRANLAVLAPPDALSEVIRFAGRTKLACWGTLTVTGLDDVYVVPGGYHET